MSIDVPFINGNYQPGSKAFYSLEIDDIICDDSKALFFYSSIVSSNLKDEIVDNVLAYREMSEIIG